MASQEPLPGQAAREKRRGVLTPGSVFSKPFTVLIRAVRIETK